MQRTQVFISYSHADAEFLARLRVHMRPFERLGQIDLWADSRITPGDRWKQEIASAMNRASIAVLLVSADFLASDFVAENELPPLLEAARSEGVRILPVVLKPCAFADIPSLAQFQSVNDPRKPLVALPESDREQIWYELAVAVRYNLEQVSEVADTAEPAAQEVSGRRISLDVGFSLYAEEFDNPRIIADFIVYQYQHIDELALMPLAVDVLSHHQNFADVIERIKERLASEGWEGDGEIRLIWFPPFIGAGVEDTYGVGAWFVKQRNNGTAWIASPVPLPFSRLLEQQYA